VDAATHHGEPVYEMVGGAVMVTLTVVVPAAQFPEAAKAYVTT